MSGEDRSISCGSKVSPENKFTDSTEPRRGTQACAYACMHHARTHTHTHQVQLLASITHACILGSSSSGKQKSVITLVPNLSCKPKVLLTPQSPPCSRHFLDENKSINRLYTAAFDILTCPALTPEHMDLIPLTLECCNLTLSIC